MNFTAQISIYRCTFTRARCKIAQSWYPCVPLNLPLLLERSLWAHFMPLSSFAEHVVTVKTICWVLKGSICKAPEDTDFLCHRCPEIWKNTTHLLSLGIEKWNYSGVLVTATSPRRLFISWKEWIFDTISLLRVNIFICFIQGYIQELEWQLTCSTCPINVCLMYECFSSG